MELFTIQCTTCRARLKVKDESAIGDILACPKCNSMVQVVPPPGWQRPGSAESAALTPAVPLSERSDFLPPKTKSSSAPPALPVRPTASAPSPAPEKRAAEPPQKAAAAIVPLAASVVSQPAEIAEVTVPTAGAWQPALELAKQNSVFIGSALAGVLVGAGIYWMAMSKPAAAPTAAENATPFSVAAATEEPVTAGEAPPAEPAVAGTPVVSPSESIDDEPEETVVAEEASVEAMVEEAPADAAEPVAAATEPVEQAPPQPTAALRLDPLPAANTVGSADAVDGDAPPSAAIEEPAEEPALPAEPAAPKIVGAPKRAERVLTETEVDQRLAQELPSVRFTKIPLAQFVDFIGEFSAVPITFDDAALTLAGTSRKAKVSVKLSHTTARAALESALAPLHLGCQVQDGRLVIGAKLADVEPR